MRLVFFLYIPMLELQRVSFMQLCLLGVRPPVTLMVLTIREPPVYVMVANVFIEFLSLCEVPASCRKYAFSLNYGNLVNSCVRKICIMWLKGDDITLLKTQLVSSKIYGLTTREDYIVSHTLTFALYVAAYAIVAGRGVYFPSSRTFSMFMNIERSR